MIQTLIILHRWGELVDCLKQWVVTPTAETGRCASNTPNKAPFVC